MVQSGRSRSRTPPHSYRSRNSAERDDHYHHRSRRRHSSRKHDGSRRSSTRRRNRHYRSPSSSSSSTSIGYSSGRSSAGCRIAPRPVDPPPNKCLGVFGLSAFTKETDLMDVFAKYGIIEKAVIVYDAKTKFSRGFGFIYYQELRAAMAAKVECNGMMLHERTIRVDYSVTDRAHTPTPGMYMGSRNTGKRRHRSCYSYRGRSYDDDHHHRRSRHSCSRSPRRHRRSRHRHRHSRRRSSRSRASSYSSADSRRSYR